jgi:hypothetical protein
LKAGANDGFYSPALALREWKNASVSGYVHTAKNWLRFLDELEVVTVADSPHASIAREFSQSLLLVRGFTPASTRTYTSRLVNFLDWAMPRHGTLSTILLCDVDDFRSSPECGVSRERVSIRLMIAKRSGAVMSAIGREPIHGKMSRSKKRIILELCPSTQFTECLANHSLVTTSKLLSAWPAFADFTALRFALGSVPFARSLRASSQRHRNVVAASSQRPRASFSPTSG